MAKKISSWPLLLLLIFSSSNLIGIPPSFEKHPMVSFPETCDRELTRNVIVQAIAAAKHSVRLYMYQMDDDAEGGIIQTLCKKAQEGKGVRAILEPRVFAHDFNQSSVITKGSIWKQLEGAGVEVRTISGEPGKPFEQSHLKLLLIDVETPHEGYGLLTTANFDKESLLPGSDPKFPQGARDFGLIIQDSSVLQECLQMFESDWQGERFSPSHPLLVWGPDHQRATITKEIQQAEMIDMYQQSVQDNAIVEALCRCTQQFGYKVRLITMSHPFSPTKDYNRDNLLKLARAGVKIHFFSNDITRSAQEAHGTYYMHAKAFLFDDSRLLINSCNLYQPSLDKNRELGILNANSVLTK